MTGECSDLNIPKKVLKYETFLNDVLKEQLKTTHKKLDYLSTEIAEYMQIKMFIETVRKDNRETEGLKTQVDIGCSFFIEAKAVDPSRITINAGCGIWLDLSLDEAVFVIEKRIKFLESQTNQEIASAVLRSGDFVSKEPFIQQHRQRAFPEAPQVTLARIRAEPVNKNSTLPSCRKRKRNTKTTSPVKKIICHDPDSYSDHTKSLRESVPTPKRATEEMSHEDDHVPSLKMSRLGFVRIRDGMSIRDGKITWPSRNQDRNISGQHRKNDLEDSKDFTPSGSAKGKSLQDPNIKKVGHNKFEAKSKQTENRDSGVKSDFLSLKVMDNLSITAHDPALTAPNLGVAEVNEVTGGEESAPTERCTQQNEVAVQANLGVAEVNEVTGGEESAPTERCTQQNEVAVQAHPRVPDRSGRQYPEIEDKCQAFNKCTSTTRSHEKPETLEEISNKHVHAEPVNKNPTLPSCRTRKRKQNIETISLAKKIICQDPDSCNDHTKSPRESVPTPKHATEEMCRKDHDVPSLKMRRLSFVRIRDDMLIRDGKITCPAQNQDCNKSGQHRKNELNESKDFTPSGSAKGKSVQAPNIKKVGRTKFKVPVKSKQTENRDPGVKSDVLSLKAMDNLSITAHDPALTMPNLGEGEANEVTGGEESAHTEHCTQQNKDAVQAHPRVPGRSKRQYPEIEDKCQAFNKSTSTTPSHEKPEKLEEICNNHYYETKNFDFRAIAKNLDVDGCVTFSPAESRYFKSKRVHKECILSLVQADQNKPEVPTKSKLTKEPYKVKLTENCDPRGNELDTLPPSTPNDLSLQAPEDSSQALCAPNSDNCAPIEYKVLQKKANVEAHPSVPDHAKVRNPAAMDKQCQSPNQFTDTQCKSTHNGFHKELGKLEQIDNKRSSGTKSFTAIAGNLDVDDSVSANNSGTGSRYSKSKGAQIDQIRSEVSVHSESDIPTVVQQPSAKHSLNPKQISLKIWNKKKKYKRVSTSLERVERHVISQFFELSPGVTQHAFITQWTGGEITVLSTPVLGREQETPHSGNDAVSAENQRSCGADDRHANEALCELPETDSVSVDGDGSASADATDADSISTNAVVTSACGTDDRSADEGNNNDTPAFGSEGNCGAFTFDTIHAAGTPLNYKKKMIEKFVNPHAKLTKDVGHVAENVLALHHSQDLDRSADYCNNNDTSAVGSEEICAAFPFETVHAAGTPLNYKKEMIEKFVEAHAKLTKDVGNVAENVLALHHSQDLDRSVDDCNDNDTSAVGSEEICAAFPFETVHTAETPLNYKKNIIEKLVNADAKLPEDVGNVVEKVVALRDYEDLDVSLHNLDAKNRKVIPGLLQMKFKCSLCPQVFACYSDIEGHSVKRHSEVWEKMKNSFLRTLVPHCPDGFMMSHPRMKLKCIFCSKLFSCYSDFAGHLTERHYGDYPYECPFCFKRFENDLSYSNHLTAHILLNDFPSYNCDACPACFSSQWELDLHSETHERLSPTIIVDL